MSSLQVQTPPTQEPVSLQVLKNHLRVPFNVDDDLLKLYLQSARETVESESGRSLVDKLYRQSHDCFPGLHDDHSAGASYFAQQHRYSHHHHRDERQMIKLLRCPLVKVQKIVYIGTDGLSHTLLPVPAAWLPDNEYEIGDQIVDSNGNLQEVTAVTKSEEGDTSQSGSSEPSPWNATPTVNTADKDITWTNKDTAPAGDFIVDADSEPPRICPTYGTFWPLTQRVPNAVQIFYVAGYGDDAAAAPAKLKVAVMMAVGVSYENREAITADQLHGLDWYERLIWSERVLDYSPTR